MYFAKYGYKTPVKFKDANDVIKEGTIFNIDTRSTTGVLYDIIVPVEHDAVYRRCKESQIIGVLGNC
ncbi:MAG: hypothetical protein J6O00_10625 [Clostridiales bacterium]|nr:hypothetical protein [Clostridiales bacterium]